MRAVRFAVRASAHHHAERRLSCGHHTIFANDNIIRYCRQFSFHIQPLVVFVIVILLILHLTAATTDRGMDE